MTLPNRFNALDQIAEEVYASKPLTQALGTVWGYSDYESEPHPGNSLPPQYHDPETLAGAPIGNSPNPADSVDSYYGNTPDPSSISDLNDVVDLSEFSSDPLQDADWGADDWTETDTGSDVGDISDVANNNNGTDHYGVEAWGANSVETDSDVGDISDVSGGGNGGPDYYGDADWGADDWGDTDTGSDVGDISDVSSGGEDPGFDFDFGYDDVSDAWPIVMDMDGDGVEIAELDESTAFFDHNGDGFRNLSSWATGGDGLLAYDHDGDGQITDRSEIAFVDYKEGAASDLDGLQAFDSNGDGVLDAGDDQWNQFGVWIDQNQDGISDAGEFQSLDAHGIGRIALSSDGQEQQYEDGTRILGQTTYDLNTGESLAAADTVLRYTAAGYRETQGGYTEFGHGGEGTFGIADNHAGVTVDLGEANLLGFIGGEGGDEIVSGNANAVSVVAGAGDDTVRGGAGSDWLSGGSGADVLSGGGGDDVLFFDAADLTTGLVDGGDGYDVGIVEGVDAVQIDAGAASLEAILAGAGDDMLFAGTGLGVHLSGAEGADGLYGGAGNDFLDGGSGADSLDGGAGDDFLLVDAADVTIRGGSGIDALIGTGTEGLNVDLGAASIEVAFGTDGADRFDASTADSFVMVESGRGDDIVIGSAKDDLLDAGAGSDQIDGGAGYDAAYFAGFAEDHLLDVGTGGLFSVTSADGQEVDAVTGVEALLFDDRTVHLGHELLTDASDSARLDAEADNHVFSGSAADETAYFGTGNDFALGREGNDHIWGAAGNDWLDGGMGDDIVKGGAGDDIVFGRDGDDRVIGNEGDDLVFGGDGNDKVWGGDDQDLVYGGAGDDVTGGGAGDDVVFGGAGDDKVWGQAGDDVLSGGDGNDRMGGGEGNDIINGGAGDDWMDGGFGDDVMTGGAGNDILWNYAGNDTLIFNRGDDQDAFGFWDPNWETAHDVLQFGDGISHTDLWLSFDSDEDLVFDVIGTDDQLSLENWERGPWARPEEINTADGYTLTETGVFELVNLMAQFSTGAPDAAVLDDPNVRSQIDAAIANAWQPREMAA
ncbi:MAG: calcium-binding protein [Pseudomonadota bacterium]